MNTFYKAIYDDNFEKVKEMVQKKPEYVNIISSGLSRADAGMSPLQLALSEEKYDIADFLIDNGADVSFVESPEANGYIRMPVLHLAILKTVNWCRFAQAGKRGYETPFSKKEFDYRFSILKKILEKNADISIVDSSGHNCIQFFANRCWSHALPHFNWRRQCFDSDFLITKEVTEDLYRVYHLLLEHGADVLYKNRIYNKTVFENFKEGPVAELLKETLGKIPEDPDVVIFRGRNLPKERYDLILSRMDEKTKKKDNDFFINSRENVLPQLYEGTDISPEKGDIFLYRTNKGTEFKGIVINSHVKDRSYEKDTSEWACVVLFKQGIDPKEAAQRGIHKEDLIFNVRMVSMDFWSQGIFKIVDHTNTVNIDSYAFYTVDYFVDEYHIPFKGIPSIWGAWYRCNGDFAFAYAVEFYMLTGSDYTEEVKMKPNSAIQKFLRKLTSKNRI